jgi:aconitate hydratase
MGAAPPSQGNSVRTFNRNFPGRSGTAQDAVWLCSPEVAAATALRGVITDPRVLGEVPLVQEPELYDLYTEGFLYPPEGSENIEIYTGPNIIPPPLAQPIPERIVGEILLKLGNNVSTDEILPGGNEVLPLRTNIPAISEFTFAYVDRTFPARAKASGGGFIVAGENYGQGSSREHAAIAPMYLGIRVVLAGSYARIHESNLVNFGLPPLRFADPKDIDRISQGDRLEITGLRQALERSQPVLAKNLTRNHAYQLHHALSPRQVKMLLAGGLTHFLQRKWKENQ